MDNKLPFLTNVVMDDYGRLLIASLQTPPTIERPVQVSLLAWVDSFLVSYIAIARIRSHMEFFVIHLLNECKRLFGESGFKLVGYSAG